MSSDEAPSLAAPIGKKPRSNKMAQLMGIDESTVKSAQAQAKKDRNFEARTQLLQVGYQVPPPPVSPDLSVGALYQRHRTMPNVWAPQFDDGKVDPTRRFDLYRAPPLMHMLMTVKHTMFNVGEPAELYFSLYSASQRKFVSEEFMLRLTMTGVCDELKAPQKCLFADVRVPDLVNGNGLWLCCRIYRLGILDSTKKPKLGSNDQAYRRPFGVAMLQLTQKLVTNPEGKEQLPPNASLYVPGAEKDFATLHEVIIEKPQSLQPVKNSGGIAYGLTMFDGDLEEIRKNYAKEFPANVLAVPRTAQLDLKTLVSARHLLYLTLDMAEFSHGTKTAQKNMLCKIQLRDNKGKTVTECIARGTGQQVIKETDFLSTVYYHNNSPNFCERICVWLPPSNLDRYHLFFDFQHVSSDAQKGHDAVALSWVPLVDEKSAAFLPNLTHKLVIWSLSKKEGVNEQYMTWDAATKEKRNTKQVFVVQSQLSSTFASCDVDLQRVLHFNSYGWETVDAALKNVLRKDVGLLLQCSSRLLEQVLEIAIADNYSDAKASAVQAAFYVMASLLQSGKENAAVLREYVTTQCASAGAYAVLLSSVRTLFAWCSTARDAEFSESNPQFQELTLSIRALGATLQLIVRSYTLDEKGGSPAQRRDDFRRSLLRLLDDIVKFVGKSSAKLNNLQRNLIVNFSKEWIDCLEPICSVAEQAKFLTDFIEKIPLDDKFFAPPIPKGLGLSINTGFGAYGSGDEPSGPLSPTPRQTSNSMMKDSPMGMGGGPPPMARKGSMLSGAMLDAALSANGLGGGGGGSGDSRPPLQRMASPGPDTRNLRGSVATRGAGDLKSPMSGGLDSKGAMNKLPEDGFGIGEAAMGGGAGTYGYGVVQSVPDDSTSLLKLQLIRGLIQSGLGVSGDAALAKRWRRHFFVALFKQLKLHIDAEREINENLAVVFVCNDLLAVLADEYGPPAGAANGAASEDGASPTANGVKGGANHKDVKAAHPGGDDEDMPPPPPPPGDDEDGDVKKPAAAAAPKKVLAVDDPENAAARVAIERDHLFGLIPGVTALLQKFLKARQHKTLPQLEKRFLANIKTDSKEYIQDTTAVYLGLLSVLAPHADPFLIELNSKRAGADSAFLVQLYDVFGYVIKYSVFHKYWVMFRMLELQSTVRLLEWSGAYLVRAFLQENRFDIPLWRQHFAVGMSAALCEDASLEDVAESRRKYIGERYGDVRLSIIGHYKATWEWVAQKHVHLAEALLGPAVDLTQSRLESLRTMGRDWYMDLIRAEIEVSGSLKTVLYHTIDIVGRVVHDFGSQKLARGKEQMDEYMSFFDNDLAKALASAVGPHADAMRAAGNQMIKDIGEMFQHLYSLESLPQQPQYEDERTLACINLMSYLKGNGRQELYVKYVNYLCELHEKHHNYVEWGNTLHLHQSLLGYGTNELEETGNLPAAVEADRKVALLQAAMGAYDKGEFWERAIEVGRDLAGAYETKLFYIAGVSSLLRQQANYWEKIVAQDRIFRAFYRVKFFGAGFGPDVRGKEFVYRSGNGAVLESVKDFTDRIKKKYPEAIVSNTPELPPPWVFGDAKAAGEYDEFDTSKPPAQLAALGSDSLKRLQYIQITTLSTSSPEELKNQPSKWDDIDAPTRLIRYHKQNNVNAFVYTRVSKKHKPEVKKGEKTNEFRDLWVLRTFVQTADPLPSIRRRAEVVSRTEVLMSPIENALFNIVTKNNELKEIIADVAVSREERVNTGPLSMNLAGVIDAAVQGGVEKYKEAFFDGTYLLINPTHGTFVNQFKAALGKQIDILRHGLDVFGSKCDNTLVPLLTHLTKTYGQMCESLKNIVVS